jgi:MFS family permease
VDNSFDRREARQWLVVASLLLCIIVVAGPTFGAYAVLFTPLLREFKVSRAVISSFSGALFLGLGISAPPTGWLLDRIESRVIAVGGTSLSILAFALAGRAHRLGTLLIAHFLMGVGVNAACIITTPYVIANWFGERRSTALGVAFVGLAVGPMCMTVLANHLLSVLGWRETYLVLAVPMLVVAAPVQLAFVRGRAPWDKEESSNSKVSRSLPGQASALRGLGVAEALAGRSFWFIALTNFLFGFATTSLSVHIVPYLISIGYTPASAALSLAIAYGLATVGNVFFGWLGDRVPSRVALSTSIAAVALAVFLLLNASQAAFLLSFVLIYGVAHQGPVFGIPLTTAECFGLRRFGSISGLIGLTLTVSGMLGPVAAGHLFDATGSYRAPFFLFLVCLIAATVLPLGYVPFAESTGAEPRLMKRAPRA